jgi:hypothetical protein
LVYKLQRSYWNRRLQTSSYCRKIDKVVVIEERARLKARYYSVCGKPDHNVRTCLDTRELSDSSVSSV